MRFRWLVLLLAVALMAANVPLFSLVSQDYIPTNVDESEFEVRLRAPEGATAAAMEDVLDEIEGEFLAVPGVDHVLSTVGGSLISGVNSASIYIRLTDIEKRSFSFTRLWHATWAGDPLAALRGNFTQRETMNRVRAIVGRYDDLRASIRNLTSFRQGAPVDIDFVVTGPNLETLADYSSKLRSRVAEIPGVVDVDITLRFDRPNLLAHIDRQRAAALGTDVQEIADTLRIAVGGDDRTSRYYDELADDAYDVELRLVGVDRDDPESISQLYVRTQPTALTANQRAAPQIAGLGGDGLVSLTRLDNLVRFEESFSPSRIDRLDRQRMVAVRANIEAGYSLGGRLEAVKQAAEDIGLPPGYSTQVLGRGRELDRTLIDFAWVFALSFVFMYIVLAAQYEHLVHPFTILLSLPMAIPFGLLSLWLGGESLNLYSALGILVLFGVVKKNAILQVDHMNQLRQQGMERGQAILAANRDRLRPILMTSLSFVAGMLPMLIATGPGAEERRSIAVLVVGGQMLSLLITLLAIPAIYSILDDLGRLLRGSSRMKKPRHEPGL
jgi:HAE1 family hydrophobic/amphiphilic exporter-1